MPRFILAARPPMRTARWSRTVARRIGTLDPPETSR